MKQNKGRAVKLLIALGLVAILITASVVASFAFQGNSVDGQITVIAPSYTAGTETARATLRDRLNFARNLLNNTDNAPGGSRSHYAAQGDIDVFAQAIRNAEEIYTRAGIFARNEEFDIIVNIAGNSAGFSSMLFRVILPSGLELVGVKPTADFADHFEHPTGATWNSTTGVLSTPLTGTLVMGWSGRQSGNFTANGEMLRLRVRAASNAALGTTDQIRFGFGSAISPFYDVPTRSVGNNPPAPITMSIQGVTQTPSSDTNPTVPLTPVQLGTVNVVAS